MSKQHSLIIYTNQKQVGKKINAHIQSTHFFILGISDRFDEIKILLKHHAPDFLIINLTQPCSNPNIHQLKIASPRTRIIIIEEACHSRNIFKLIQSGADSFLPSPFYREDTIRALNNLTRGEIFIPSFVAKSILEESQKISQNNHEYPFFLTDRDHSILSCLSINMELDEIRAYLKVDEDLIRAHLTNILQKIHFSDIVRNHFNDKLMEIQSEITHHE